MSPLPIFRLWLIVLAMAPIAATYASGTYYRYDTVHSQILFSISHDGYSRPFGRLHIAQGWLRFDANHWSDSATELDIDLAGVDMGDAAWNVAVCKPALLACTAHRHAHFASTSVERTGDRQGILHGQLSLRGISVPLDIPFTFNREATTLYGLHKVAGFSATTSLERKDFGINAYGNSIGQQVSVWLEIEAIRDDHASSSAKDSP